MAADMSALAGDEEASARTEVTRLRGLQDCDCNPG